jgi:hypothetical protein
MNVWIIYRRDRFLRGTDDGPFLDRWYPGLRMTEPNEDYRHEHQDVRVENGVQFGDLPQFVDYSYIANVARVNLAALANGPAAPSGVKVEASTLTVDTTLEWQPNTEPDLAGYEIVYRDTNMPYWQHTIPVGNVTSYTLKGITKDNFLFGVRAVDKDGNRSVVTFPVPKWRAGRGVGRSADAPRPPQFASWCACSRSSARRPRARPPWRRRWPSASRPGSSPRTRCRSTAACPF